MRKRQAKKSMKKIVLGFIYRETTFQNILSSLYRDLNSRKRFLMRKVFDGRLSRGQIKERVRKWHAKNEY